MKRILFIFTTVMVVVSCVIFCAVPAAAASGIGVMDPTWFDYTVSPTSGGNYIATFSPRSTDFYWERYLSGNVRYTNSNSNEWKGQASQIRLLDNIEYMIYPFGQNSFVDLMGIALDDPKFNFTLNINWISDPNASFDMKLTAYLYGYPDDGTGDIVHASTGSTQTISYVSGKTSYSFDLSFALEDGAEWPDGVNTIPLAPVYKFEFINLSDESSTVQVSYDLSASLSFDVLCDANYANYLLELKGQGTNDQILDNLGGVNDKLDGINGSIDDTNNKLDDTNSKLDDTNNKLDDIINGEIEPSPPEGSGDIQDAVGAEDDLLQDMIGDYENNKHHLTTGDTSLRTFYPSLQVVVRLLNLFLAIDFFKHLTYISLSLGVLVVLLNVGSAIIDRADRSARSAASESRRGRKGRK